MMEILSHSLRRTTN